MLLGLVRGSGARALVGHGADPRPLPPALPRAEPRDHPQCLRRGRAGAVGGPAQQRPVLPAGAGPAAARRPRPHRRAGPVRPAAAGGRRRPRRAGGRGVRGRSAGAAAAGAAGPRASSCGPSRSAARRSPRRTSTPCGRWSRAGTGRERSPCPEAAGRPAPRAAWCSSSLSSLRRMVTTRWVPCGVLAALLLGGCACRRPLDGRRSLRHRRRRRLARSPRPVTSSCRPGLPGRHRGRTPRRRRAGSSACRRRRLRCTPATTGWSSRSAVPPSRGGGWSTSARRPVGRLGRPGRRPGRPGPAGDPARRRLPGRHRSARLRSPGASRPRAPRWSARSSSTRSTRASTPRSSGWTRARAVPGVPAGWSAPGRGGRPALLTR